MIKIFFYLLFSLCFLTSTAFEVFGIYSVLGISIYMGLSILIAFSKLYLSLTKGDNKNQSYLIIFLSIITIMFALSVILVDYLRAIDKIENNNVVERLNRVKKDIFYTNKSLNEMSVKEVDIQKLPALYKNKGLLMEDYNKGIINKKDSLRLLNNEKIALERELKGFNKLGAFLETISIVVVEIIYCVLLSTAKWGGISYSLPIEYKKDKKLIRSFFKEAKNNKSLIQTNIKTSLKGYSRDYKDLIIYLEYKKLLIRDEMIYSTKSKKLKDYLNNKI